jgi:hypothetical protein
MVISPGVPSTGAPRLTVTTVFTIAVGLENVCSRSFTIGGAMISSRGFFWTWKSVLLKTHTNGESGDVPSYSRCTW